MKIKIKFIKFSKVTKRKRTTEVEIEIGESIKYSVLKQLWDTEQSLNNLTETDTRVHVEVME